MKVLCFLKQDHVMMATIKVKTGQSRGIGEFFSWKRFSRLQKLLTVVTVVLAVSWILSLWTLLVLFILSLAGALKFSNEIAHHKTGPMIAKYIASKLEEALKTGYHVLENIKMIVTTHCHVENGTLAFHQKLDNSQLSENESDKLFDNFSPQGVISAPLQSELNSLQLLIIRDFVQSWYSTFSYNNKFLRESKYIIQQSCNRIAVSLSRQNPHFIMASMLRIARVHVTMYMKAKSVFDSHQIHPKTKVPKDSMIRYTSVEDAFEKEFGFHEALKSEENENNYLRGIMSIILLSICPKETTEGICTRTLLVEIITNNVFIPLMYMMSDPDWLMEQVILLTSDEDIDIDDVKGQNSEASELEESLKVLSHDISNCEEDVKSSDEEMLTRHCIFEEDNIKLKEAMALTESEQHRTEPFPISCQLIVQDVGSCGLSCGQTEVGPSPCAETSSSESEMNCNKEEKDSDNCLLREGSHCDGKKGKHDGVLATECVETSPIVRELCDLASEPKIMENSPHESVVKAIEVKQISGSVKISNTSQQEFFQISGEISEFGNESEPLNDSYEQIYIESNPQKILSYNKSIPFSPPIHESKVLPSEPVASSFPKLSSLKKILVDSLKPGNKSSDVPKPKTLDLFPDSMISRSKASSLTKETSSLNSNNGGPPLVLVDGKPAENVSFVMSKSHATASQNETSTAKVDAEVSPGWFSSIQPFFSKSSSQSDLSVSSMEALEESPIPTPSPTDATCFDLELSGDQEYKQNGGETFDLSKSASGDHKIFQDISIPHAITNQEFRSSSQYSLYVIEYDALYFNEEGKCVLKSGVVKRRHREFTNLQSRLERHPSLKTYLKNIRGPRRWPTLPFKSLDKETVESRRLLLDKYLKDLISIEAICNGPDLREFLAYEGDSHIAFVKKSPDISVPRFDKMLMRGVSEVVDKIKSIPNIPSEVMSGLRSKESIEDKPSRPGNQLDTDGIEVNTVFDKEGIDSIGSILNLTCHQLTLDHDSSIKEGHDLLNVSHVIKDLKSYERTQETYRQEVDKLLSSLRKSQEDASDGDDREEFKQNSEVDISPVLLELLILGLQGRNHWICKEKANNLLQAFCGKALNSFMKTSIDELTSEPQLVIYLRLMRETIWPQGKLWSDSQPPKTDAEKAATGDKAKKCLKNFFPIILQKFIGEEDFDAVLEVYIACLHCRKLNRHLLYHLLDFLIEQLFPDATSCEMLQTLLFSNTSLDCYL